MWSLPNGILWTKQQKKNSLKQRKTIIPSSIYTIVNLTLEKCNWNVFFYLFFIAFLYKKPHTEFSLNHLQNIHICNFIFHSLTHSLFRYIHIFHATDSMMIMTMMMRLHDQWQTIFSLQRQWLCDTFKMFLMPYCCCFVSFLMNLIIIIIIKSKSIFFLLYNKERIFVVLDMCMCVCMFLKLMKTMKSNNFFIALLL